MKDSLATQRTETEQLIMDPDHYSLLSEIVAGAIDLGKDARQRFLDEKCGSDNSLLLEVEELLSLQDDDDSTDLFAEREIDAARDALEGIAAKEIGGDAWLPEKIGRYRIQSRIGAGGMGVVYKAIQESPHRPVAIKLMHPMHATQERIQRFRVETELLGRLKHPNIAQIYEAGLYDIGSGSQPFFAMELVDGYDIRSYCDQENLDIQQRLKLLAKVCDGVQHAHDQGVIHRDIKADNVLIDERGQPKVLDFGIARASTSSTLLSTVLTDEGSLVGTLAYMAPEQLDSSAESATLQVDVYALGVLGFEILTGRLPFEITDLSITAAITLLNNNDPPSVASINPRFRGDVETIIQKALESDPARRYPSAASLAADIHRHLDNVPIQARPPTRAYRLLKFTRRHRGLTLGAVSTFITLVIGLIVSVLFASQERDQRIRADENALEMRRSEARVVSGLMESAVTHLERGDYWEASKQHRLVPSTSRDWGWRLLALSLPDLLDVSHDLRPLSGNPPDKGRPRLRFLDDDRIVGLDHEQEYILLMSLDPPRKKQKLFGGLGLQILGEATPTGLALAWRENETLLLDLNLELIKATWSTERPQDLGNVSDDGKVVVLHTSNQRAEVWVEGELQFGFDFKGEKSIMAPPHCRIAPDGETVFINELSALRVIEVDSETERTFRPHGEYDRMIGYGLTSGWITHQWRESRHEFISSRLQSGREPNLNDGAIRMPGSKLPSAFRVPRNGAFVVVSGKGFLIRDPAAGKPLFLSHYQDQSGWLKTESPYENITEVSPGGRRLLTLTLHSMPWLLEPDPAVVDNRYRALVGHTGSVEYLAISHDGSLIASACPLDPLIRLWDSHSCELLAVFERLAGEIEAKDLIMAFSQDDDRLVITTPLSGHEGAGVVDWNLAQGSVTTHWPKTPLKVGNHVPLLDIMIDRLQPKPRDRINHKVHMANGKALAVWQSYQDHWRWVTEPPEEEGKLWRIANEPQKKPRSASCAISVHPVHDLCAIVAQDQVNDLYNSPSSGILTIRNLTDGSPIREIDLARQPCSVVYSPDGERLAIGTYSGHLLIIETQFYTTELEFRAHQKPIFGLVWTPDGERLVTGSRDSSVRIWDPRPRSIQNVENEEWKTLRSEMSTRADLSEALGKLEGRELAAARAECIKRNNALTSKLETRMELNGEFYVASTWGGPTERWYAHYLSWETSEDHANAALKKEPMKWRFTPVDGKPGIYTITNPNQGEHFGEYLTWDPTPEQAESRPTGLTRNTINAILTESDRVEWHVRKLSHKESMYRISSPENSSGIRLDSFELSWKNRPGTYPDIKLANNDPVVWYISETTDDLRKNEAHH